ncbi:MAG: hypothetical protein AB7F25_11395 [Deferribacterales bacterium]
MRYFKLIAIFFLTALLASCGGGTTSSKTRTSLEIKLQLPSDTKKRTKSSPRFTIGNTSISKVQIGYGLTGESMTALDVTTEAENQSSVTISQLEAGKEYSFTVAAYSGTDTLVCQGGDTLTIVANTESDLTLTCSFQDKYALENFVFGIETGMINETITESDMEDYVADSADFGVYNGMDRDSFISDFIAKRVEMKDNGLSLISVQMLDPRSKKTAEDTSTAKVKYIYSDGSYRFQELWAAKIDDEWKLVGNGHSYDLSVQNQAAQLFSTASQTEPDKVAGITVGSGTTARDNIASFTLSGDGISSTNYSIVTDSDPIYAKLTSPSSSYYFKEINENMTMYGSASAVNDGDPYVFAITTVNSESETDTQYIDGEGITAAEMEQDVFPAATVTVDNYCTKTVNLTMPTAYTPSWVQIDILVLNSSSTAITSSVKVPLNGTTASVDMSDALGSTPQYSEFKLTAYDSAGRAFSTYYSFENLGISVDSGCTSGGGSGGSGGDIVVDGYYNLASLSVDGMNYSVKFNGIRVNSDNSFYGMLSSELFTSDYMESSYFEPIVANFNSDGTAASAYSVQHTNANSENTMFRVKVFKTSDGSQFIVSGNNDNNDRFVSVMKINAAGNDIDWIKKYQSSDTGNNEYHKFIDASVISDSVDDTDSTEEILLLIKGQNADEQFNSTVMILKVSSEDGSILNSSITTVTNSSGGIVPIKMAVIKPYDTVAVLAYTCADDGTTHSSMSLLALDSELTLQNAKELYEGFDTVMYSISDNMADETLLNNIDMAAGINGKIYITFTEDYLNVYIAEISTDLDEYGSAYDIQSISFIKMDNGYAGYYNYIPRIAVVTSPSETENLIYYYSMTIGSTSGDIVIMVYLPILAQLTEAAFDGSSLANGIGYNWAIEIPNMQMPGGQLTGGAASSVFLTNTSSFVSVNVDGESGDNPIDSATNTLSFSSYSMGDPLNNLTTIGFDNAGINDMNVEDIDVSSFSLTQRELSIMDLADMP